MKMSEVLATAIAEAASIPIMDIKEIVALVIAQVPPDRRGRLEEDIENDEALRLLSIFKQEQQGIRNWLRKGYLDAVDDGLQPFPCDRSQTNQAN